MYICMCVYIYLIYTSDIFEYISFFNQYYYEDEFIMEAIATQFCQVEKKLLDNRIINNKIGAAERLSQS